MEHGINLDPNTLIQVLENKLALSAVREAQMEAAIQALMGQQKDLTAEVQLLKDKYEGVSEDASADN